MRSAMHKALIGALALSLTAGLAWAFKPAIHEDISEVSLRGISRTVDGETLQFTDKAIVEIRRANSKTDLSFDFFRSFKHFDGELFAQASQHLVDQKSAVISGITASSPNGQKARQDLGTALHTLQDFYAHSNWVEIGSAGINSTLGRGTLANPPAATAFCPGNREVLGGAGLTQPTTGYYVGLLGCGPTPAGKCAHGGPGGCDGINKDEPGRTGHGAARSFATQASTDYIDQILDASGVAGNAKAIKALMRINGTLGMVIDDTGSMGPEISQVKAQVAAIVGSVSGTDKEPDEYLLVRFGDPDVGPPFATTDSAAYLSRVNALRPSGGGDCPELSQSALLQAIGASRNDSNLYLFTDASSKDASLANSVNAAAQTRRIKITPLLTGSCSPIDPAYRSNAQETGGQLFVLSSSELGKVFDLVRPQLTGDFVTIRRSQGSLTGTPREFTVPVDSTVSRAVFSASIELKGPVSLRRPDGTLVAAGDPGVTITQLSGGTVITVESPAPGDWLFSLSGSGAFTMAAQANSPLELFIFEFVELFNPVHPGYRSISGQPVAGTLPTGLAHVLGPYVSADFRLVDEAGATLAPLNLVHGHLDVAADEFLGTVPLPDVPFRVAVSGFDAAGETYDRLFPTLFRAQTVEVRVDAATEVDRLPIDATTTFRFEVTNLGAPATFRNVAVDSRRFVRRVSPTLLTLGSGESGFFEVDLFVPAGTAEDLDVLLTATATSASNSAVTNSDTLELLTSLESNQPPDCGPAADVELALWPPNHKFEAIDLLETTGVTDPDGDPLTLTADAITQDEPVLGTGSGDTSPDGDGVGSGVVELRAERDGDGNGRVYNVAFTADDGRGGTCNGVLVVTVPHSQDGEPAVDDGQLFDSTLP